MFVNKESKLRSKQKSDKPFETPAKIAILQAEDLACE